MKVNSLSEKLILYFVLLGAGAIFIIATVSFYSTKKALISRTFDQLTSLRVVKKSQIERFYADRMGDIASLATAGCSLTVNHPLKTMPWKGDPRLNQYFNIFYLFDERNVLQKGSLSDTVQGVLPEVPPEIFEGMRSALSGQPVAVSDMFPDLATGKPCQLIAVELKEQPETDRTSGRVFLALSLRLDAINDIMLNNDPQSGLGQSGETYLVGTDLRMRSESRFQSNSILRTRVETQASQQALSGVPGMVTTNDYRNIPVLSSYDLIRINGLKWAILAEIDVQEAMVPIYVTRSRILLLSIIILLLFFGCVLVIVRRITRPIIRLRDATVNLGKGKYDIELPLNTNDEIGALTASFNVMARQIKEKTSELQQERSGRMRSVFDGEEMERQRLSRELHDGIGQSLIAVKLRLENLLYLAGTERLNSINELKKYFDQIIDEVRRMSNDLMPSVLEVFSIPIAFRNLFTETEEHSNFKIYFESTGNFDDLDKKTKTYIYRLAQEALNNIVKHAQAREVRVWLTRQPEQLSLVIQDDGIGFSPEIIGIEGGNGIHNMRERAGLLKGTIDIISSPRQGTIITVTVPIINTHVKNQDFSRR